MVNKMLKNKKGNIFAIVIIMVFVVVVGFTVIMSKFITGKFFEEFNDKVEETDEMKASETKYLDSFLTFDYSIVVMVAILIVGLVVTSFLIPSHPIFIVINIIGIFVLVFLGMVLNNVFGELVTNGALLTATADQFPKLSFLVQNLPFIGAILVFLMSVIMYSRGSQSATY